jgi:hypothetical protein
MKKREPVMGLTFEKVWAMFQESDRRMRELREEADRRMQEADRRMQETDRRMQETDQRMQETDRQIKETDRQMKETRQYLRELSEETDRQMKETQQYIRKLSEETERKMQETNRQIGKLGNRFGELTEHLVAPNIVEKFNALGYHFDDIFSGLRQIIYDESSGRKVAEFDIILENRDSIVGVEVKSKPCDDDVKDHVRRLGILRLSRDSKGDKRKIYGALAGAIMPLNVRDAALKAGLYVITQTGDTVKIDIPEGFTPKTW